MSNEVRIGKNKFRITQAGNTGKYALACIYARGYKVFIYRNSEENKPYDLWAIKDGRDFIADTPETLLGLIIIWEQFGDDWLSYSVPRYEDRLSDIFYPEDDYNSLDDDTFAAMVTDLRIFFDALGEPIPNEITRQSLAKFIENFSKDIEKRANQED